MFEGNVQEGNDTYYQQQKESSGPVEFSDVQIVHKFAG